jgi:FkbM family methyltransferase
MTAAMDSTERLVLVHDKHLIRVDALDSLGLRARNGIFEPEEIALCKQLIHCGDRVLDIGANIGYHTVLFCDLVFPNGSVTAIEPDSENFGILKSNLRQQAADGIVSLHQLALGSKEEKAQLFRAEENTGMHRMYASVCCGAESFEVSVIQGDSLALAPLDFIKIDIEGYEPFALLGLRGTLKQSPKLKILCEFSPLSLLEAGYSPVTFLHEMRDLGLHLLVLEGQSWRQMDYSEMTQALERIPALAIAEFGNSLRQADGNQAITEKSVSFLRQHAYSRPILENVLFVAPDAWQSVCKTLNVKPDRQDDNWLRTFGQFIQSKFLA